jgi:hypothetical protein
MKEAHKNLTNALWMRTWDVETLHATDVAELVPSRVGVESVGRQLVLTGKEAEFGSWNHEMVILLFVANAATACKQFILYVRQIPQQFYNLDYGEKEELELIFRLTCSERPSPRHPLRIPT